jgi:hypothetical protein
MLDVGLLRRTRSAAFSRRLATLARLDPTRSPALSRVGRVRAVPRRGGERRPELCFRDGPAPERRDPAKCSARIPDMTHLHREADRIVLHGFVVTLDANLATAANDLVVRAYEVVLPPLLRAPGRTIEIYARTVIANGATIDASGGAPGEAPAQAAAGTEVGKGGADGDHGSKGADGGVVRVVTTWELIVDERNVGLERSEVTAIELTFEGQGFARA